MTHVQQVLTIAFYAALLWLCVQSVARLPLLVASSQAKRTRSTSIRPKNATSSSPSESSLGVVESADVLVQLPIYNEPRVCGRLIRAAAGMEPREQIDIQIVDDSTDATPVHIQAALSKLEPEDRARFSHLTRDDRTGYKAGALQNGMAHSAHDFVAIFDADFVPSPEMVAEALPHFADAQIGMVQFAWGWLNRDESWWTRAQAALLDAHFGIDQPGRARLKLPFNFNGTAGIWRREAIETSGGWQHDTITEDLDLSYRAQLQGWKFAYVSQPSVPSELPTTVAAYRSQQHRWAKGGAQTARKLGKTIARSDLDLAQKLSSFFHLHANTNYVLTVCIAALLPFIVHAHHLLPQWFTWAIDLPLVLVGACLTWFGYWRVQRRRGAAMSRALSDAVLGAMLDTGIAAHKARGVIEAWIGIKSPFVRTPKAGERAAESENESAAQTPSEPVPIRVPWAELILSVWLAYAIGTTATSFTVSLFGVPFLLWFFTSFSWVAAISLYETFTSWRSSKRNRLRAVGDPKMPTVVSGSRNDA